jgi:hypothetical protein
MALNPKKDERPMNVYQMVEDYAECIMANREYWDADDLCNIVHEYADSSEYVMNWCLAHDFVAALPRNIRDAAEDEVFSAGWEVDSYDRLASLIAYTALFNMLMESVTAAMESDAA